MVAMLVLLVILTASAVGFPAIWLIRNQLDQQARALVDQGSRSTLASLSTEQAELINLTLLTAQRPTLGRLVQQGDREMLGSYLLTLLNSAGLDLILVCNSDAEEIMQVGLPINPDACQQTAQSSFYSQAGAGSADQPLSIWMLSAQPITDASTGALVIAGTALNQDFAHQLKDQTGLDQVLVYSGGFLATSFAEGEAAWEVITSAQRDSDQKAASTLQVAFKLENHPYYAASSHFQDSSLEMISALSVENIAAAQRTLTRTMIAVILLIVLIGSGLGILFANRVTQPLERLRESAIALRQGDLSTPIYSRTRVAQIAQVAYALEDARIVLQHSLSALRQEKEWTDHLLDSIQEGILTLDRSGRITFFSHGAEQITGFKQERVVGKPADIVFRTPDGDERFSQRVMDQSGKQAIVNVLMNDRQAALAVTAATLTRSETGQPGTVLVFRDFSEEEAIRRLLGDFLANITHEFRTPLSALAASIELLLDQLQSLNPEELRELLDSLHLGILGLQTLVDNLLEGASIEAGRFRVYPRPVEISEIIQETIKTMQPLFDKYDQRLSVELSPELPVVQADPRRTGQALINLLSNAIKWSPPGSEIILQAEPSALGVQISVGDQGPGVSPDHRSDLFTRFTYLRSGNQRAEYGAGIGLSVVKAIVETQGGQVGVMDRSSGGSIFWFTIPAAPDLPGLEDIEDLGNLADDTPVQSAAE
jgi:PAS domain S-box-containing protein